MASRCRSPAQPCLLLLQKEKHSSRGRVSRTWRPDDEGEPVLHARLDGLHLHGREADRVLRRHIRGVRSRVRRRVRLHQQLLRRICWRRRRTVRRRLPLLLLALGLRVRVCSDLGIGALAPSSLLIPVVSGWCRQKMLRVLCMRVCQPVEIASSRKPFDPPLFGSNESSTLEGGLDLEETRTTLILNVPKEKYGRRTSSAAGGGGKVMRKGRTGSGCPLLFTNSIPVSGKLART